MAPGADGRIVGRDRATRGRSDVSLQLSYAMGGGVEGVVYAAINNFLLFYMTVVAGLSPSLAGVAMLISLIVDGISDPIIGSLSDNSRSPHGKRHPFMIVAILPICLAIALLFSIPAGLETTGLFVYALTLNVALRLFLALFAIPYAALSVELWSDYQARSRISVYRNLFFAIAHVALLGLGFQVFFDGPKGVSDPAGYPALGWTAAGLTFVFGVFAWATTRDRIAAVPPSGAGFSIRQFVRDLMEVAGSPSFRFILLGCVATWTATNLMFGLNLLALNFSWGMSTDLVRLATLAFPVGFLLGVPAAHIVTTLVEKRTGTVISIGCLAALLAVLALLGAIGWLPARTNVTSYVVVASLGIIGLASMVFSVCLYAMIGDAVDEHDLLFNTRKEGMFYAAIVLGAKIAAGLGAMLAGFGMDLIGASAALADSPPMFPSAAGTRILLLWGLAPATIYLVAALLFARYRIDKNEHASIVLRLENRRLGTAAMPSPET